MKKIAFTFILAALMVPLTFYGKEKNPLCPIEIVAGQSIGPFNFKMTEQNFEKIFPSGSWRKYPGTVESGEVSFFSIDGLMISFCNGVVNDMISGLAT